MIPIPDRRLDLIDIADRFGTPTYVTDSRLIGRRIAELRERFGDELSTLLYALKANPLPDVVEFVRDRGLGLDVVSPGELLLAERLGVPADRIFFSANNASDDELAVAHSKGAIVNIGELSRLESFGKRHPGSSVSVRLNTEFGAGHHRHVITAGHESKFGIPVSDVPVIQQIADACRLTVVGAHQHIGSGNLDVEPYRLSVSVLFSAAEQFTDLQFVNVGGGLGVPYRPGDDPMDLGALADVIGPALRSLRARLGSDVDLWMEPGRYLVAEAGTLLIRVNTIKVSHGHVYAGTDSGMNHLVRPAMYGAYHEILNLSNPSGEPVACNVVGNICESSDFFARDRLIPEIREGDLLAVLDSGAYGSSMASEYNLRPVPAEVFVDSSGGARLVRARETAADLVDRLLSSRL